MKTRMNVSLLATLVFASLSGLGMPTSAQAAGTPPTAPLNVTVSNISGHSATAAWDQPADTGGVDITSYVISVSLDGGSTSVDQTYDCGGACATSESSSLGYFGANTSVQFAVKAVNQFGEGPTSSPVIFSTTKAAPLLQWYQPTVANKFGPHGGLMLTWNKPANDGGSKLLGYKVYYRAAGAKTGAAGTASWKLIKTLGPNVLKFETPKFAKGKNWEIAVGAYNAIGVGIAGSAVIDIAKNGTMQMFR